MIPLTREEIAFVRDRGTAFATGDQLARIYAAAEAHLAEPARLAAARAEGVREGIEMAAKWHDAEAENASRATGRPGVSGSAMLTAAKARGRLHLADWLDGQDEPNLGNDETSGEWVLEARRAAAWIKRRLRRSATGRRALEEADDGR